MTTILTNIYYVRLQELETQMIIYNTLVITVINLPSYIVHI